MGALLASWWGPHVKPLKPKLMEMVMQWSSSYKHSCTLQPVFVLNLESLIILLLLFCNSYASLSTYLTWKIKNTCKQMNRKNIFIVKKNYFSWSDQLNEVANKLARRKNLFVTKIPLWECLFFRHGKFKRYRWNHVLRFRFHNKPTRKTSRKRKDEDSWINEWRG